MENHKKYLLTDLFDTVLLRLISPEEIVNQWAELMIDKFDLLFVSKEELVQARKKTLRECREAQGDVPYAVFMESLYEEIKVTNDIQLDTFADFSHMVDLSLEYGCNTLNTSYIKWLKKQKQNGTSIVCVTDYYLCKDDVESILEIYGVEKDLFDEIYVSSDLHARKSTGSLYKVVLEKLSAEPTNCYMVGDSRHSDVLMARKQGIKAHLLMQSKLTQLKRRAFKAKMVSKMLKCDFKSPNIFLEYAFVFYGFTKKLWHGLKRSGAESAAFVAREGWFLKLLFEKYSELLVPSDQQVNSTYFRCSRRSVSAGIADSHYSLENLQGISFRNWLKGFNLTPEDIRKYFETPEFEHIDFDEPKDLSTDDIFLKLVRDKEFSEFSEKYIETNQKLFKRYIAANQINQNKLHIVDSGWRGTIQKILQKDYGVCVVGHYLGVQEQDGEHIDLERYGYLFSETPSRSKYCNFLDTNIPFYQQLLAAPHGSAICYTEAIDGSLEVVEHWDQIEKDLYYRRIVDFQDKCAKRFAGYCAWLRNQTDDKEQDWLLAKTFLKSSLFCFGSRFEFIDDCNRNYLINFGQEKKGKVLYNYKEAKIGLDIIWNPSKYIKFITKIQKSSLYDIAAVRFAYRPLARLYYFYTVFVERLRDALRSEC